MKVVWIRDSDKITFTSPSTWFVLGLRGAAKSTFLEDLAMHYAEKDAVIFDMFASRDGESLAWLRSPYAKDKKILLLKGDNVDVTASVPVKRVDQLTLADVENFDIIISSSPLYLNPDQEFFSAAKLTDLLYKRLHYKRLIYLLVREASNFYYSRLKISDNQLFAKANMIYMIREARHVGIALGLDTLRFMGIDVEIRSVSDYTVLKSQGVYGLASDLEWLYSFFNPSVIRCMKPQNFILVSRTGALGLGTFPYHDWHKEEKEDMLANVGVKVEYGEQLHEAAYRGSFNTVSDKEHAQIIEFYLVEGMGMNQIATKLGRSSKTPYEHIHTHNEAVERSGFCPLCKRVGAGFFDKRAQRAQIT
jgi:hypothetical protein